MHCPDPQSRPGDGNFSKAGFGQQLEQNHPAEQGGKKHNRGAGFGEQHRHEAKDESDHGESGRFPGEEIVHQQQQNDGKDCVHEHGQTVGVPQERIRAVADGESVMIGDLEVVGWHTPGHAIHHVAWKIGDAVSTGDVAGIRFPGSTHVQPPLPPPDIDVEKWKTSLELLRRLEPKRLLLTHFGAFDDVSRHLDELEDRLIRWTNVARRVVSDGGDMEDLGLKLERIDEDEMKASEVDPESAELYPRISPVKESSSGLFLYCSLKEKMG